MTSAIAAEVSQNGQSTAVSQPPMALPPGSSRGRPRCSPIRCPTSGRRIAAPILRLAPSTRSQLCRVCRRARVRLASRSRTSAGRFVRDVRLALRTAQNGLDAGYRFAFVEGLGQIVIGAEPGESNTVKAECGPQYAIRTGLTLRGQELSGLLSWPQADGKDARNQPADPGMRLQARRVP